jgi:D-3-phosphoglycerate dehydrogenase
MRGNPPVTTRVLTAARGRKIVVKHGAGTDSVDRAAMAAAGIPLAVSGEGGAGAVAELTLAMILALRRNLPMLTERMRAGHWDRNKWVGTELADQTLGLIGLGRIGSRVARLAAAFGLDIVAAVRPGGVRVPDVPITALPVEELLARADVVSLHCPLTAETRGLIGHEALARMKPGAILINTARGGLVDEAAVAQALTEGRLAGAGFDTFSTEPIRPDNPLLTAPNVLLAPHVAAETGRSLERTAMEAVDHIFAALGLADGGAPPP